MGILVDAAEIRALDSKKKRDAEAREIRISFGLPVCKICTEKARQKAKETGLLLINWFDHPDGVLADSIKMERDKANQTYTLVVRCHGTTHEKTLRERDIITGNPDVFFDDFKMFTNRGGAHHRFKT